MTITDSRPQVGLPITGRPNGVPTPRRRRSGPMPALSSRVAVNLILLLVVGYTFFPLVWTVLAAFKDAGTIGVGDVLSLQGFAIADNVRQLGQYENGLYFRWLANSFLYAGVGGGLGALICIACGYAFDKYQFRGKEKLFGLVLTGVLVPSAATTLPMYLLASHLHLVNTYWAVLIPSLVNPFGVYLARVFSSGYIPNEVLEAARVDGASEFAIFRRIGLPMIMPGYVTILLFQVSSIWNGFYLSLVMLTDPNLFPVSLGIYQLNAGLASTGPQFLPDVMLGSLISIIPMIVVFMCLQRFWKAGLTAGSVK